MSSHVLPATSAWLCDLGHPVDEPSRNTLPQSSGPWEYVIIGAGMSGASLALHLAQSRGDQKTVDGNFCIVLEAREVSGGASGRNGGICHPRPDSAFEEKYVMHWDFTMIINCCSSTLDSLTIVSFSSLSTPCTVLSTQ